MITWLNTSSRMQFQVIDGLTVRFAQSEDCSDHALLLSPWPESMLAFGPDVGAAAAPFAAARMPARMERPQCAPTP